MANVDPLMPRVVAPSADVAPQALGGGAGNATFQRLLENLESLARASASASASAVTDADGLQQALRRADDDYVAAMDMRRRLLDALGGSR